MKKEVREILDVFKSGSLLSVEVQEKMRDVKNQLSMMVSRVASSQRVLAEITGDDEELALMNLTTLKNKPKLYKSVQQIATFHFGAKYFYHFAAIHCVPKFSALTMTLRFTICNVSSN